MSLTIHLYEVLRLRMSGGKSPPLLYACMACAGTYSLSSPVIYKSRLLPYIKLSCASVTKNDADVVLGTECCRRVVAYLTHPASYI
jgi:hypothetical protein